MNKKTFTVALLFLFVTIAWWTVNIIWFIHGTTQWFRLIMPTVFVACASIMTWREFKQKKRKHVEDVKHYI